MFLNSNSRPCFVFSMFPASGKEGGFGLRDPRGCSIVPCPPGGFRGGLCCTFMTDQPVAIHVAPPTKDMGTTNGARSVCMCVISYIYPAAFDPNGSRKLQGFYL